MRREYPGLGFDPVPVDLTVMQAAIGDTGRATSVLSSQAAALTSATPLNWTGPAAAEFRGRLDKLPAHLTTAADAHRTLHSALTDFVRTASTQQRTRDELERDAQEAISRQATAAGSASALRSQILALPGDSPRLTALTAEWSTANRAAEEHADRLLWIRRQAGQLNAAHTESARLAADAIAGTPEPPMKKPGMFERIGGWFDDHLRALTTGMQVISTALGVAAFFFPPAGLLALGVAAAALAGEAALAMQGEGSWTAVGIDGALLALPGVAHLVRKIPGVEAALDGVTGAALSRLGLAGRSGDEAASAVAEPGADLVHVVQPSAVLTPEEVEAARRSWDLASPVVEGGTERAIVNTAGPTYFSSAEEEELLLKLAPQLEAVNRDKFLYDSDFFDPRRVDHQNNVGSSALNGDYALAHPDAPADLVSAPLRSRATDPGFDEIREAFYPGRTMAELRASGALEVPTSVDDVIRSIREAGPSRGIIATRLPTVHGDFDSIINYTVPHRGGPPVLLNFVDGRAAAWYHEGLPQQVYVLRTDLGRDLTIAERNAVAKGGG